MRRGRPLCLCCSDALWDRLSAVVRGLDVLVALGTHPPLSEAQIGRLLGIEGERRAKFSRVQVFNHDWNNDAALVTLGTLSSAETRELSQGLLSLEVPVRINARVRDYDVLLVLGPVFPHEVVGFSGGNKYFFPGHRRGPSCSTFSIGSGRSSPTRRSSAWPRRPCGGWSIGRRR